MTGRVARVRREGPSGDREDVRTRVLHSRPVEEQGDREENLFYDQVGFLRQIGVL